MQVTAAELAAAQEGRRRLSFEDAPTCPWYRGRLEGMIWPYSENAPAVEELKCAVEVEKLGGNWYSIPTSDGPNKWGAEQCTEARVRAMFGGRRRYRVSIRVGGNTLPGSGIYFDLSDNQTPPRAIPGLARQFDPAFAEPAEDGGLALAPPPKPEAADTEPLGALEQLLVITKDDPGLAILAASVTRLPVESQFVASTLTFTIYEQRRMMASVMAFVTDVMQSMATGRHAPPEVSAIYRDLYARAEQRAHALAEQNEALKQHTAGTPGAPPPSPGAEIAKIVVGKVAEKVTEKFMAGMTPEMMQQLVGAMGGA